MRQEWLTLVEATKRSAYLVGLPIGVFSSVVLLYVEAQQGTLHIVDRFGLPLLALLLSALTFGFWRRRSNFLALELTLFAGFALMLLASLSYTVFQIPEQTTDIRNLTGLGYWTPVLYTMAFLIFGVRIGVKLSVGVYLTLLGVWLGYFLTTPSTTSFEQSVFFQLFASDGLMLLLLYTVGTIIKIQARHAAQLELAANTDPLTLLSNRRHLIWHLEQETVRAARYHRPFSVIMVDIDHFKEVNDRYGHDVGDATLREMGALLLEHARSVDVVGRWGGEEFLILSPELKLDAGGEVAERLREVLETHPFRSVRGATASFGVAEYRAGESVAELLNRADGALYEAKAAGRNRVVMKRGLGAEPRVA